MAPRVAYSQPQAGGQGFARTKKVFGGTVNLLTTDLVTTAITAICRVPAGFIATNLFASASDMDTNGTPTLALNIGDAGSAARLLSASTIGQAGTSTSTIATTGAYYQFTADTDILLQPSTNSATAAAGTLTFYLEGFMANP
ncbi:hypothetical protein [Bradyrhizobium elkanii]|jgi:hypothetical protein|uniref:hypothetical protein n=1 Tax=Bradyrhizobium elkanii TaxID=29448 RepID=UPI00144917CB|nr:hypothetical protein [Bradyrhizobium elkanii]MCP1932519.1 hypothetical protein [Bradyrhizobium elkanii]MCS3479554.1 hypothetical protein [Bradyrhizobium elkanii]MCS3576939.1 hypothetical protein [Bradyrhizobium elkanii]MCS3719816.1 hypothetical protein [Bradyrhizobium elkanii]MCS4004233.1 hypothetical protein [Bradyrhizobium elkanii USDA 61]